MSRTVIGFALATIICATVFAQGLPQSDSGDNLSGKYVIIQSQPAYMLVGKFIGVQKLSDRSFAVCDVVDENRKVIRTFVPIDSIKILSVFESMEAALGENVRVEKTNVTGLVTLRGKPLMGTILFHDATGATYSGDISNDGKYDLSNIPVGSYTVTFDKVNLPTKYRRVAESQIKVDVRSGNNVFDFALD